ncbi:hypothetical protein [Bythopirellula polymerisocia]|uniref:Protein ArsC n=1 Tax=Bythopirellula polymerisocia TaxID=2528003 RepID=A0A5C6CA85_9BACT|nr:hypothetical protein [Bythopirellula polymerisocia]TWU20391.1 Protein ArsC [Bythopirellula polymerisocia]
MQKSQTIEELADVKPEVVINVCSHADEKCPMLPTATHKMHVPFDDPAGLARNESLEEKALEHYRSVRDEIRDFVQRMPEVLAEI